MNGSVTSTLFPKNTGFGQLLDAPVRTRPEHTAVVCEDTRLTYAQLGEQVDRLAAALERDGVKPGEPVALISRNSVEYLLIELALFRIGAVSVKINWRFSPEEIQYLIDLNEVRLVFVRYERWEWARRVKEIYEGRDVRFIALNQEQGGRSPFEKYMDEAPPASAFRPREIAPEAPLFRIHTSGTTGKPKCVVHTHGDFMRELCCCVDAMRFTPDMVYQMVSQLFHIACIGAYMTLALGGTVVLLPRFEIKNYLETIERERSTGIGVLPVVLKRLLDYPELDQYDLSSLNRINYSTCPMPPALLERAISLVGKKCRFFQSYGMTEMSSIVTVLEPEDHFRDGGAYLTSVGRPIPGVEVRIQREDGTEADVGERGEILLRGPGQMSGYFRAAPGQNEAAMAGGWYHSKDMGYLDEKGYLYVSGRKDDMIISGGENIYPNEVVDVLMRLTDDIAEVAVYGVPDLTWGEQVQASVVLLPGSRLTEVDLREYCRANMPHYKVPKRFYLVDELPKNTTGKVLIPELVKRAQAK